MLKLYGYSNRLRLNTKPQKDGTSLPWSHSSWIYRYLCIRCLSPL